ncbi:glycosyltransferase WbsX family protein [Faecalibaculum rodentium]|jgi:hypothetical protein|uniref:glycosyltransferase WbsX family protein n=1 Tax=Faecalibaculum rodentium TaxID=1702221 RepID=UPI00256ECA69|nr:MULTISPECIES: glycoside hydrolase family 99-like domain-containing protein [Bacteria]
MEKIIAYYLPQFHRFKENDEWWGEGFTEWTNVKGAKPLFAGHNQPRIPLDENYYNLLDPSVLRWQTSIAKKYGIYGFCFYHYWFDGHMLMEKPMELLLEDKTIDFPFCICWANENWTKAWADSSKEILISQTYGDKDDWISHFEYFKNFFLDDRYIKIDEKPVLVIYRPEIIPTLREMIECWNDLAIKSGLPGICYMYQQCDFDKSKDKDGDLFDYEIEYQPGRVKGYNKNLPVLQQQSLSLPVITRKILNTVCSKIGMNIPKAATLSYSYDSAWRRILKMKPHGSHIIPGAFVDWDNTPRYGSKGSFYADVTPSKFERYLTKQLIRAKDVYHSEYLFLFAWNEWGEGGYLEPDTKWEYGMLEAVKKALLKSDHHETR